jgi:hypothetical protein
MVLRTVISDKILPTPCPKAGFSTKIQSLRKGGHQRIGRDVGVPIRASPIAMKLAGRGAAAKSTHRQGPYRKIVRIEPVPLLDH